MLVLSRREGEAIYIGDDIIISVRELGRGQVRLTVQAPAEVPVHRSELLTEAERFAVASRAQVGHKGTTRDHH